MPPPASDQAWPPASPAQLASLLLASLQHVTSSARLLLTGCFQCGFLKAGCWRRQEEQDGAWFDCDKLQVEHPYCYVNPVALSEATPATALRQSTPSSSLYQPRPSPLSDVSHHTSPRRTSAQRPPGCALSPRGLGTHSPPPPPPPHPKRSKWSSVNGSVDHKGDGQPGCGGDEMGCVMLKGGEVRYVRGQGCRAPLVESFVAKLEADLRKLEYDRQRAEGEMVEAAPLEDGSDSPREYVCHENQGDTDFSEAVSTYPYEDFEDQPRLDADVWKPSELEDVFECYNMAAFYSYGATFPAGDKFSSKLRGEKFEDVFPVSPHNNNNNTIKVYKPACESQGPLPVPDRDEAAKENVCETQGTREKRPVSEDQLKQFIHSCVLADSVAEVAICFANNADKDENCDDIINFGKKSFNKLLIFNLVKSEMSACAAQYPRSLSVCSDFPVHLVQKRVIKVMLEEDKSEEKLCGLQVFHSSAHHSQRERLVARRRVEGVATGEVKAEDKRWRDFNKEEQEMKDAIYAEVFHDLINDTAGVFTGLVARKLATVQELM